MGDEDKAGIDRRVAFLKGEMEPAGFHLPDDVIRFIASFLKPEMNTLIGALIRLEAYQSMTPGRVVSVDDARDICKDMVA